MSKFDHLRKLEVAADRTAEYIFYEIEGNPTLICRPATESNAPYYNDLLRSQRKNLRTIQAGATINTGMIAEERDHDRGRFARHIVVGWKNVTDSEGNPVPFGKDVCEEWLTAIPDRMFDGLRAFCGDAGSFLEVASIKEGEGKNS